MNRKILIKNTIMLYIIKFSNYFFTFITIPLQTRILGPQIYGNISFALTISIYFQNFIDFGFTLSATEKISKNSDNKDYINTIFSRVFFSKLFLIFISTIIYIIILFCFDLFQYDRFLFALYYISAVLIAIMPDFLYLGLQNMKAITYRTIISRIIFTILLFLLLKNKNQYLLIPIFTILGNLVSLFLIFLHIFYVLKIKIKNTSIFDIINEIKYTFHFFLSRIALTAYQSLNTILIGILYGTFSYDLGYYKPAEQSISIAKQSFFPIIDSLYPYMSKYKDFKLYKKILIFGILIILILTIFVDIFAYYISEFIFGSDYSFVGKYIIVLSPNVLFSFLTMMFGFPLLSPMDLTKYANYSNIFSAIIHIFVLLVLFFTNNITIFNLCILISLTEFNTFIFRFIVVILNKERIIYEKKYF